MKMLVPLIFFILFMVFFSPEFVGEWYAKFQKAAGQTCEVRNG
jgi:hypothetical protein